MPPSMYDVSPSDDIFRDLGIIPTFPTPGGNIPPIMPMPQGGTFDRTARPEDKIINLPGPIDTAPVNMPNVPPISYMGTPPVGGNSSGAMNPNIQGPQSQAPPNPRQNPLRQPTRTRPPEVPATGIAQPRNPAPQASPITQWIMGPSGREAEWEKVPDTRQNLGPSANRSTGGRMATPQDPWVKNPSNFASHLNARRNALTPKSSPMYGGRPGQIGNNFSAFGRG